MHSESVTIYQESCKQSARAQKRQRRVRQLGTACFLEENVKRNVRACKQQLRDKCMNLFVGMLEEVARYVHALSRICAVYGEEKWNHASPYCLRTLCQATLEEWPLPCTGTFKTLPAGRAHDVENDPLPKKLSKTCCDAFRLELHSRHHVAQ